MKSSCFSVSFLLDGWQKVIDEANKQFPGGAIFVGDNISARAAQIFDGIHTYNPAGSIAGKKFRELKTRKASR